MIDYAFQLHITPPTHTSQQKGCRAVLDGDGRAYVVHYKRAEVARVERAYLEALRPHAPAAPLHGPVAVSVAFYYPATKDGAAAMRRAGVALRRKISKPDADNVSKSLLDCMTSAGFFADDSVVALLHIEKLETAGTPRIQIRVRELDPFPGELFPALHADERDAIEPA